MININKRLSELEALSIKKNEFLSFNLMNNIFSSGYPLYKKLEFETPFNAVYAIEQIVLKKQPNNIMISYSFDDVLDLYPVGVKEIFNDLGAVRFSHIMADGATKAILNGTHLAHCILYQCVQCLGCDCVSNSHKGINYTKEQFKSMMFDQVALLTTLHDIISKMRFYKGNCQDDPDYEYMIDNY